MKGSYALFYVLIVVALGIAFIPLFMHDEPKKPPIAEAWPSDVTEVVLREVTLAVHDCTGDGTSASPIDCPHEPVYINNADRDGEVRLLRQMRLVATGVQRASLEVRPQYAASVNAQARVLWQWCAAQERWLTDHTDPGDHRPYEQVP